MHERTLIVYPNPSLLAQAVAARTLLTMNEVLGTPGRDRIDIAVTGGTDGTAILEAMASSALLGIVDWSRVHVWWGDERFVPPDSDERNDRVARAALFDKLIAEGRMADAQIHAMPADDRSADARAHATAHDDGEALERAAARYQQELLHELGEAAAMDLMMFGVGPDDERFVPPDSDERNDRAARAALFDKLIAEGRMTDAQIHAMPADNRSADARAHATAHDDGEALEQAAARYQQELLHELGEAYARDLMMFCVGPDGHREGPHDVLRGP